jgi:undecaprenyl-diphosphatase
MFWGAIDLIRRRTSHNAELAFHVLIGTIPIIIVGLLLKLTHLDEHIRSATLVAVNAIVFGILLYAADTYGLVRRTVLNMNWKSSLIIGGGPLPESWHKPLGHHHDRRPGPWFQQA